jgi:replicative DNA helicase Mcm
LSILTFMPIKFTDFLRLAKPLIGKQKSAYNFFSLYLEKDDLYNIKHLLKQKKVSVVETRQNITSSFIETPDFVTLHADSSEKDITEYVVKLNHLVMSKINEGLYQKFSKIARDVIPKHIGAGLYGFDMVKAAVALQLFATEPIHILLLGDPGTGKTEILHSAVALHPISSFGLGSGTSGVGLSVTVKGNEVLKGLLPKADLGICAIDELNLMEEKDRASLYNAMEKGFITYDKGGEHYQFDARVRIIATANPKGDKFSGWTIETLKRQLPFDSALLSRFHLVFLIRKAGLKRFVEISNKIVSGEGRQKNSSEDEFIKGYVEYAEPITVTIPNKFKQQIVDAVAEIKKNESKYLIEVSPRVVLGFVRLAKASARMQLRKEINQDDINFVKGVVAEGLRLDVK